jgi:hypothetical protein
MLPPSSSCGPLDEKNGVFFNQYPSVFLNTTSFPLVWLHECALWGKGEEKLSIARPSPCGLHVRSMICGVGRYVPNLITRRCMNKQEHEEQQKKVFVNTTLLLIFIITRVSFFYLVLCVKLLF